MKRFLRAVASLTLCLCAVFAFADWTSLAKEFNRAKSHDEAVKQLKQSDHAKDQSVIELLDDYDSASTKPAKEATFNSIKQVVSVNSLSEHFTLDKSAESTAKQVKQDAIYKTQKEATSANWFQKLIDRLTNKDNNSSAPKNSTNTRFLPGIPEWVGVVIKGLFYLLCAAIVAGLIYMIILIPWSWTKSGRAKKAKKSGMLEDGELLLSEDEYLIGADRLIAEGRFREACRALYLAALLRLDKTRVARFEPAQTNWEHLRRIESSKTRPEPLEFRSATKAFDMAWYGFRAKSASDVLIFRETYVAVKALTEGMP